MGNSIPTPVPARQTGTDLFALVLQHPDIVVQPRGTGEATAWCPWHPDKEGATPNLGINVKKKIVKCFVCGQGGIRKLAQAWGFDVPAGGRNRTAPKEPFLSAEAAMQVLEEAYGLKAATIAHFRIETAPNYPSPSKAARGAWKYPTHGGMRYKAFDRKSKPKYWWRGADPKKIATMLYGAKDVPPHTRTVYLVNGEPSVWVCWQANVLAVCAFGEGNLPSDAVRQLHDHGVREVRVVLDLDTGGDTGAFRDLRILQEGGIEARAYRLPDYLGEKADVANLYTWCKHDAQAFALALDQLPEYQPSDPAPLSETRYSIRDGRIMVSQATRDGSEVEVALSNFVAYATEEIVLDDGIEPVLNLVMHAEIAGNYRKLSPIKVPVEQFASLSWLHNPSWGIAPIIKAGASSKEQVREVLQRLSLGRGLPRRTIYTHTGWRKLEDDRWRYLMPYSDAGAGDGVEVELSHNYARFQMPGQPQDAREAAKASLRFLDVGDHMITIPVLAYVYLAPLQSILSPAFALWLRARTGSFKSTIAALAMCHFGDFNWNHPPATWDGTPRGIERMLFDLKDCVLWVDDFAPKGVMRDMQILNHKAEEVLRAVGDRQGRIRMQRNTKAQESLPPRAMLLSTAEIYPSEGESVMARIIPVDFTKSAIDREQLSMAQAEQDLYKHAMGAYVRWLGARYADAARELPDRVAKFRDGSYDESSHARISHATATMLATFDLFLEFAKSVDAIAEDRCLELRLESRRVLGQIAIVHTNRVSDQDTISRYLNVIDTLLTQDKVLFMRKGDHGTLPYGKDLIGWFDADYFYMDPEASYNRVARFMRDEGRTLGIDSAGLRQGLLERGILEAKDPGHLTTRLTVNGRQHRVLLLRRDQVPFDEAYARELPL